MADLENEEKNLLKSTSKKNLEKSGDNSEGYNRKRVDIIKGCIVAIAVLVCALPIYLGFYVLIRFTFVNNKAAKEEKAAVIDISTEEMVMTTEELEEQLTEDYAKLDSDSTDDMGKVAAEDKNLVGSAMEPASDSDAVSNGKTVYLTFDDGPSQHTDKLLDVLAEYKIKATFFVVCNPDESLWPMYKRIVEEGHTLAMHSYTHVYSEVYASEESFIQDVTSLHDFLYEETGVDCRLYRFPGGSSNTVSRVAIQNLIAYLNEENITYFDWNALSGDAVNPGLSVGELNANIMESVRSNPGDSVVLMHDIDACGNTLEALPELIETLQAEGYTISAIDEDTEPVQHVSYDASNKD
jgi:peptidoglycan/xylan/chitin deacetylase (PgdA/CDA1 family)